MPNVLSSIPSSMEIRDELEQMVVNDLLGPVGGPEEEIDEQSVRDRYLVGMLAPRRQELSPEEFDELPQGGSGAVEDGATEYTAPSNKTMFPSSFGMTFCVDPSAKALRITARWGHYYREHSATLSTASGDAKLVWKRSRREAVSEAIPLQAGRVNWVPDDQFPEVQVQGLVRWRKDFWSVTLFLVNGQDEPKKLRDTAWLFQPELIVESLDGEAVFHSRPRRRGLGKSDLVAFAEEQEMGMLYRRHTEFGVGHGVSIHADCPEGVYDRAFRLSTSAVPAYQVSLTTSPTVADWPNLESLALDMMELGRTPNEDLDKRLRPLLTAYSAWIAEREGDLGQADMTLHQQPGRCALERCREALARIEAGLKLVQEDEKAAEAFRFANSAMWQQRIHTIISLKRRRDQAVDERAIDVPVNRSWYPFQLAFILLNLPGLTRLDHPDRIAEAHAVADLLWFPTGGGKTEAYLGLAAYTMALRRLQGAVAGRSGEHGVAVLMRYTLRLLTIQQFQRAAALICACEVLRRNDESKWGKEPFRIGLWVGQRTTPNTTEQAAEAVQQAHGVRHTGRGSGSPAQLTNCPWCGARINAGQHIKVESYAKGHCRTITYCGDVLGRCSFSARQSPQEGIPALVVDEEIYRRLPTLLIATVDKFAQMPWNGKTQMLFGQVESRCDRHGFRSPEIEDADSHPKRDKLPTAKWS